MRSATWSTKTFIVRKPRVSESSATGQQPKPAGKPRKFQAIKGVRDLLPAETPLWNHVEEAARTVFGAYGFGEIRLPIFEPTELFARSIGLDTDVVSKEMYTFIDATPDLPDELGPFNIGELVDRVRVALQKKDIPRDAENKLSIEELETVFEELRRASQRLPLGVFAAENEEKFDEYHRKTSEALALGYKVKRGERVTLRPEATASVCRAYIEHNMQQLPQPVKLYYLGPMFRRERPQKGRFRQFYQIGAEVLGGNDAPGIDAEVIDMVMTFFDKLELPGLQLDINSIGHNAPECRPKYVELLRTELHKVKDQLGPDSQRRIETNPLRVLDSKLESEQAIIATLPHIADHLCDACNTDYADVKNQLQLRGVIYHENWRLVRGLDYYMRTTFEITAKGLGSQNAVSGGGRYDGLVELLGGPQTKGIGF